MRWVYPKMSLNPTFSIFLAVLHLNFCFVAYVDVVPSVTHCILGKPDQFRVTCPSIRKSNISQCAYYARNTQYLSTKLRHLTSKQLIFFFNSYLLSKQRRNRRFFTTSAEICALVFMGKYVYNANHDMIMLTSVIDGF